MRPIIFILVFLSSVCAFGQEFDISEGVTNSVELFDASDNPDVSCYRIPALVTAPNGDLVVAIDERVPSCGDLKWSGDINIVIRRSSDNGKTWSDIERIVDYPQGQSASDPSMIVDKISGEIFLFYNYMDLDKERNVYYLHVVKSSDNGKTWSVPEDITSQISKPEWHNDFKFITSGRGIQTSKGKLLHCMVNLNHGMHLFGSDDHGKTWYLIDTPIEPANESKVAELADGSWIVNARTNGKGVRWVHVSTDEGKTWTSKAEKKLIDPGCNGSIIRYTSKKNGYKKNRLLFANANSEKKRENMTVRISYDEGKTWSEGKTIYSGGSAYSSLTVLENGEIGLVFEKDNYHENTFVSFSLDWLTDGKDAIKKTSHVSYKTFNYPVLKNKKDNPAIRILVENFGKTEQLNSVKLNLKDFNPGTLKSIRIYSTGVDSAFSSKMVFAESSNVSSEMVFNGNEQLLGGKNFFWLTFDACDSVDLLVTVSPVIESVQINQTEIKPIKNSGVEKLRFGVAVRQHRQDNVHTYRIPGLATTNNGTLLAIYDVRREGGRDLQGDIDIGVSRSTDGGNSWEPMRIALDMGEWGGLPQKFNGVSDADILVDKNTGTIFIAGLWMHGVIDPNGVWYGPELKENSTIWNHQWRNKGSQPGYKVNETSQFLLTKSIDDGKTWSKPVNLTEMCKKQEWWLWAPAPGHGITLDDGTLVIPTQGRDSTGLPFSNITYSIDNGKTWQTSNPAYSNTTENMAVQLSDGSVMLNMRNNRNRQEKGDKNGRAIAVTKNLGKTWTEHETSCSALIEPVCMACIHKHYYTDKNGDKKSVLLFSNPNSKYKRHKQTIKASFDDGKTWPQKYWIELDEGRGAGYSCLTSINENTIGILYEGSQAQMTFQQINIHEILEK